MTVANDVSGNSDVHGIAGFLLAATALYHNVSKIHLADDDIDTSAAARNLLSFIRSLDEKSFLIDPVAEPDTATVAACSKIGQDLMLRVQKLLSTCEPTTHDTACKVWTASDAIVLRQRLENVLGDAKLSLTDEIYPKCRDNLSPVLTEDLSLHHVQNDTQKIQGEEEEQKKKKSNQSQKKLPKGLKGPGPGMENIVIPHRPAPVGLLNDFILDSLAYKSMYDREDEVERAHDSTFDWVFADQGNDPKAFRSKLIQWITTDHLGPIYWITGKPGSGKSTFMQYLFQHQETATRLQEWSSGIPVCTAGFFFWTSGSVEQRSQTGLLRSLLHQMLTNNPELTSATFPDLWAQLIKMTTKERIQLNLEWTTEDLMEAFLRFTKTASTTMKLCLFIDGLDEFQGNHDQIISLFKDLGQGDLAGTVKMCLSSRPWQVFADAFQHSVPNFQLQDLTFDDMYHYVEEKLKRNAVSRKILEISPSQGADLIQKAVEQANGVFLWVRLAVEQILGNISSQSSISDLIEFLQQLPTELDDLFSKLLFTDQSHDELGQTASIYQLLRARELVAEFIKDDSANALTVWELAFAFRHDDDDLATSGGLSVEEATEEFVSERCSETITKVKDRFAGLLGLHARRFQGNMKWLRFKQTSSSSSNQIEIDEIERRVFYIHRTVRDWLVTADGIHDRLIEASPSNFDAHLRLLRSYVLRMKRPTEEIEHHRRLDDWWPDIALAMTHARYITNDIFGMQRVFLNEMSNTISWLWLAKPQDPYDHWARNAFGSYEARMHAPPMWQPFLCLAIKFGLTEYVRLELGSRNQIEAEMTPPSQEILEHQRADSTPLLAFATEFLCSRQKTIFPLSDIKLVEYLLKNPSRINRDANHQYIDVNTRKETTAWLTLLKHLRNARRRNFIEIYDVNPEGTKRWAEIVAKFIEAGEADANAVVVADNWDPEISAIGVMELLDDTYHAIEIHNLKELLLAKKDLLKD